MPAIVLINVVDVLIARDPEIYENCAVPCLPWHILGHRPNPWLLSIAGIMPLVAAKQEICFHSFRHRLPTYNLRGQGHEDMRAQDQRRGNQTCLRRSIRERVLFVLEHSCSPNPCCSLSPKVRKPHPSTARFRLAHEAQRHRFQQGQPKRRRKVQAF